ncbi:MAG: DUF5687 family protein [Flavobacterium sp.]
MIKRLLTLEWKSFIRSASFQTNLALKILMAFGALYFILVFLSLGTGAYFLIEDYGLNPVETVNKFMIYYLVADLAFRFFLQNTPVMNIRPLLYMNISKNTIVGYTLGKSLLSFFNGIHWFFFLPFSIVLLYKTDYTALQVLGWFFGMMCLIYAQNFLNILMDKKDEVFYGVVAVSAVFVGLQYYDIFDITQYTGSFFQLFLTSPVSVVIPMAIYGILLYITFTYFRKQLFLDAGLAIKQVEAQSQEFTWLNQFGTLGTFIKNDIRLILRNKRSKTTIITSVLFLFYGLLFFTQSIEVYQDPVWKIFAGIFVSGGFLFTFGQFVPSWDSSYYPLMMSQNIQYRQYLNAKWWLIVIVTAVSTVLCSFYLYFGWDVYLAIIVGAIYNIGVNAHIVLWGGAYIKTPIDLTTNKNAFGDKKAFNVKTMLLTIPKLLLPLILYAVGHYTISPLAGMLFVAGAGVLGFAFKEKVFTIIEQIYKSEKYETLAAYKQKN